MGDIDVDIFLERLKELITSSNPYLITNEKQQLESLEKEIKYLREFLKVTEKKRNEHSEMMELVKKIRDVVSEAEDIIDLFVIDAFAAGEQNQGFKLLLSMICFQFTNDSLSLDLDLELEGVKKEINTLTAEVKKIYEENMYNINGEAVKILTKHSSTGIGSGGGLGSSGGSNTSKVVKEKVVVGFEEEVKSLMDLLDDRGEGKRLEIITIIGAAGGGKTTLAREVYHHPYTSYTFEIRVWVDVSQDYANTMKKNLLIRILKSVSPEKHEDCEEMSEDMLGEKVLKCLKGKKYLIVMDDIWGIEAWNDIQRSFPKEWKGSKVLLTSRLNVNEIFFDPQKNEVVLPDILHHVPHRLAPLPKSWSWELLQKKVFGKKGCPQELEEIGEQIAGKCGGLPLAIIAIAGILATEDKTLNVWKEVAERLSLIIEKKNQEGCMEILELSYNHLPLHLKACFLYIGAFLEDYEIPVRELIWLWIAEGFIQQSEGGKSLEAIAEDYLTSLIDRSLVMVARKRSFGGIKACRIHDLLRVLCLKKAKEDNFFVQIYEDDPFSPSATNKPRRLFIGCQLFFSYPFWPEAQYLHSILCPGLPASWRSPNLSLFFRDFKLLRVFSALSVVPVCRGEIEIGHSPHLRYLAFQFPSFSYRLGVLGFLNTRLTSSSVSDEHTAPSFSYVPHNFRDTAPSFSYVPHNFRDTAPSFSNLLNLETLNLQASGPKEIPLPRDIFKMVKLRHLYSKGGVFQHHFSHLSYEERARIYFDRSSKLDSLQTLHRICPCNDCQSFLARTPNLRKLGVYGKLISDASVLMLPDLGFLNCLETLNFTNTSVRPLAISREWPSTLPAGLKFPPSVTQLTLKYTLLKWEELSVLLQALPSLEVLKLLDLSCCGLVWDTSELEGFSQLKYLRFRLLDIKKWNASEDQFPRLEVLVVEECRKLEQIPIDFANLNELRELKLEWCSHSVEESAREIQEEQRKKRGDDGCLNLLAKGNDSRRYYHDV